MQYKTCNGWVIDFRKNIHMYTHSLKATKSGRTFDVECEDTPDAFVGIWPYSLNLDIAVSQDLLEALSDWAKNSGMTYRLYRSKDDYETNSSWFKACVGVARL
jgi:hypothetical protein